MGLRLSVEMMNRITEGSKLRERNGIKLGPNLLGRYRLEAHQLEIHQEYTTLSHLGLGAYNFWAGRYRMFGERVVELRDDALSKTEIFLAEYILKCAGVMKKDPVVVWDLGGGASKSLQMIANHEGIGKLIKEGRVRLVSSNLVEIGQTIGSVEMVVGDTSAVCKLFEKQNVQPVVVIALKSIMRHSLINDVNLQRIARILHRSCGLVIMDDPRDIDDHLGGPDGLELRQQITYINMIAHVILSELGFVDWEEFDRLSDSKMKSVWMRAYLADLAMLEGLI